MEKRRVKRPGLAAPDWLAGACYDDMQRLVPNLATAMAALRSAPPLAEAFAYDEMAGAAILEVPLLGRGAGERRLITDVDVGRVQEWLQLQGIEKLSKDVVHQAVDLRAHERAFHPVRDYLSAVTWDGRPRLEGWLTIYLGAAQSPYHSAVGAMFLISMVARVFGPGCKADHMPVLEGEQGARKSTACQVLAGEWFSDRLPDVTSGKDVAQHLAGKWLIEIGELSAIKRGDAELLKQFLARSVEKFRPSYGRREVVAPRQCIFIGSTNDDAYLKDATGGRRFWPVKVGAIDIDGLRRDRDQLFAEAVKQYRDGAKWWPEREFERTHIKAEQEARLESDPWEDAIREFVDNKDRVRVNDIAREALHLEIAKVGTVEQRRISNVLKKFGWARGKSNSVKFYARPGTCAGAER
jgi:predicted P-loop ATPase